jgi:hypothetical protein
MFLYTTLLSLGCQEGVPPAGTQTNSGMVTGNGDVATLALQSQVNALSRQFAEVIATLLHGKNGPAVQSRRMAAIEVRIACSHRSQLD